MFNKHVKLSLLFLLIVITMNHDTISFQATAVTLNHQQNSGTFSRIGLVCYCCNDANEECKDKWEGNCKTKLKCLPWKHY